MGLPLLLKIAIYPRHLLLAFSCDARRVKPAGNSQIFVDKTGLIEYLNKRISTEEKCIALSHARHGFTEEEVRELCKEYDMG